MKSWKRKLLWGVVGIVSATAIAWGVIAWVSRPTTNYQEKTQSAAALPFGPGERAVYTIRLLGLPLGECTFEVLPRGTNGTWHFQMSARTKVYPVRYDARSAVNAELTDSITYTTDQQDRSSRKVRLDFDTPARTVSRSLNDGEPTKLAIPSGTVDYLAMLYRLRLEKLANEPKVAWAVTDGKNSYQPRLNSVEREVITIGEKQYPAIRVEPDLGELRGVFNKSPDAKVQIWFSDDTRQVPLRIRTKIYIGSFIANLKDYRPPTR
tara:strand:+ start:642 stop:1436 length:795 start_codon:yes stop_codon:yes gene_type:complete